MDLQDIEEAYVNGDLEQRVPHNLNVSFNYVEGESLMMAVKNLAVSSGSACTSASLEPSYVLKAIGREDELAHSSIRFSVGRYTTEEDIDYAVELIKSKVGAIARPVAAVGHVQGGHRSRHRQLGARHGISPRRGEGCSTLRKWYVGLG